MGCLAWAAALVVLWQCARGPDGVQELARHTPQTPVAECLRLLSIGAHFPSPEVLLLADDITAYEYLLTLRVF